MSSIVPLSSTPPTSLYATPATTSSSDQQTLTTQDFMQLLVTQLQNQDPSSPMSSTGMVQQTTELGMMQEMSGVQSDTDSSLALQMQSAAAALLGNTVSYQQSDGSITSGVVSGVSFSGSAPTVTVNGSTVALADISGVTETASTSDTSGSSDS